jgi:uncharacterized protein (DUF2236 family)
VGDGEGVAAIGTARVSAAVGTIRHPRARMVSGLRSILSGDSDGTPDWVLALADGEDAGYFGPGSPVWAVHGDLATLIGGVRALLMQALHPAAVTGVDQHSTYRQDPLGRLSGTNRWLATTTFAARAGADREAARVRGMHRRVVGSYTDADGQQRPYRAADERLLAWVHLAFTDSFLASHLVFGGPIPAGPDGASGPDAYVGQWAKAAELIGLPTPPRSTAELDAQIAGFAPELTYTEATRRTLEFLRRPPLPVPAAVGYQVLYAAAISTLRPEHRELLQLPPAGIRVPQASGRALLATLRAVVGDRSPAVDAARRRIDTLAAPASRV